MFAVLCVLLTSIKFSLLLQDIYLEEKWEAISFYFPPLTDTSLMSLVDGLTLQTALIIFKSMLFQSLAYKCQEGGKKICGGC